MVGTRADTKLTGTVVSRTCLRGAALSARYRVIRNIIAKGQRSEAIDRNVDAPMDMPAWKHSLLGDTGPLSIPDVEAVFAYLLTLQRWDEED